MTLSKCFRLLLLICSLCVVFFLHVRLVSCHDKADLTMPINSQVTSFQSKSLPNANADSLSSALLAHAVKREREREKESLSLWTRAARMCLNALAWHFSAFSLVRRTDVRGECVPSTREIYAHDGGVCFRTETNVPRSPSVMSHLHAASSSVRIRRRQSVQHEVEDGRMHLLHCRCG